MPADIVILTGPPAAGKTTVARLLAQSWERGVHIEADLFWQFIRRGFVEPWRRESHDQNATVTRAVAAAAAAYAAGNYTVVVDGIVGPWFLPEFCAPLKAGGVVPNYVVLRPPLDVTLARARSRPAGALAAEEPLRQMYRAFEDLGLYEAHVVLPTVDTPSALAARLRRLVDAGEFRLRAT